MMSNGCNFLNISVIQAFIVTHTFYLCKKFFKNTETDNKACWDKNDIGLIGLNFLEALKNACYDVKDIDDLSKLKKQSDWQKVPPGVS